MPKVEVFKTERIEQPIKEQPQNWSNDIAELERYFNSIPLPVTPVYLSPYTSITDVPSFIQHYLKEVKENNGRPAFLPVLEQLKTLRHYLMIQKKKSIAGPQKHRSS